MSQTESHQYATCACKHCGNKVEFEIVHDGTTITCPHCFKETMLFIPKPEKTATRIRIPLWKGGQESALENYGLGIVIVGWLAGLFLGGYGLMDGEIKPMMIAAGVVVIVQSMAVYCLFCGFGEIIRLLKQSCGLKYGGEISKPQPDGANYQCSSCKVFCGEDATKCMRCGANFV